MNLTAATIAMHAQLLLRREVLIRVAAVSCVAKESRHGFPVPIVVTGFLHRHVRDDVSGFVKESIEDMRGLAMGEESIMEHDPLSAFRSLSSVRSSPNRDDSIDGDEQRPREGLGQATVLFASLEKRLKVRTKLTRVGVDRAQESHLFGVRYSRGR